MMAHYLIELAILLLVAYFAGALVGCVLRKLFGAEPVPEEMPEAISEPLAAAAAVAPVAVIPVAPPRATVKLATLVAPAAPLGQPPDAKKTERQKVERPKGIAAARGGKADKLQRISGVGPKNEKILHGLGIFHFDQIAAWSAGQVSWVDDHLKFNGRIKRENWIRQARLLAEGKDAEFAKHFGSGGLRTRKT